MKMWVWEKKLLHDNELYKNTKGNGGRRNGAILYTKLSLWRCVQWEELAENLLT